MQLTVEPHPTKMGALNFKFVTDCNLFRPIGPFRISGAFNYSHAINDRFEQCFEELIFESDIEEARLTNDAGLLNFLARTLISFINFGMITNSYIVVDGETIVADDENIFL